MLVQLTSNPVVYNTPYTNFLGYWPTKEIVLVDISNHTSRKQNSRFFPPPLVPDFPISSIGTSITLFNLTFWKASLLLFFLIISTLLFNPSADSLDSCFIILSTLPSPLPLPGWSHTLAWKVLSYCSLATQWSKGFFLKNFINPHNFPVWNSSLASISKSL